ncbi:conotoxin [Maribacter sp. SA7]|uniref:conotoxin n=1 Tax=Maribacter zhoushanensis TaxID=3030012 RepID=UPI0023ECFD76|nr:conotoxin [Maribacter zhoushanensis]MDF4203795.1 conotoxin [Maribacter zhoushanensis]
MKLTINLLVFLLLIFTFSCKQKKQLPDNEVSKMWSQFLNILETHDTLAFKKASYKTIRCYDCLENTPFEAEQMSILREQDSLWYDKIYDDLINIPTDSFIANDYNILFNQEFIKILQKNETIIIKDESNDSIFAHILVTTTPPTLEFEGSQHSFTFFKDKNGQWKFNEISTIP